MNFLGRGDSARITKRLISHEKQKLEHYMTLVKLVFDDVQFSDVLKTYHLKIGTLLPYLLKIKKHSIINYKFV